jgi:hypothetical protein
LLFRIKSWLKDKCNPLPLLETRSGNFSALEIDIPSSVFTTKEAEILLRWEAGNYPIAEFNPRLNTALPGCSQYML